MATAAIHKCHLPPNPAAALAALCAQLENSDREDDKNKADDRVHVLFWSSREIWKWIFFFLLRNLLDFVIKSYGRSWLFGCLLGKSGVFYPSGSNSSEHLRRTQGASTGISSWPDSLQCFHLCKNYNATKEKRTQTTRTEDCHGKMIKWDTLRKKKFRWEWLCMQWFFRNCWKREDIEHELLLCKREV